MPVTAPPTAPGAAPPVPSSTTPEATFDTQLEAWHNYMRDSLQPYATAVVNNVASNATDAAANATAANLSKVAAASSEANAADSEAAAAASAAICVAEAAAAAASVAAGVAADADAAEASAIAAEASRVAASKLNLGAKSSPPTLDNQGAALLAGATYYDTNLTKWRVWSGTAWADGVSAVAGVASVNGLTGNVVLPEPDLSPVYALQFRVLLNESM